MRDMHGIILAYSSHTRLKELAEHRTASSIPFGGRYRVIDFMLSNMVNAGITDVGVIMHENYQSLLDHLGSGKDWDMARKRGGLRLLPPFGLSNPRKGGNFSGSLEALRSLSSYIERIRQEYVVIADGDLTINLPLDAVYRDHIDSGADITCVCTNRRFDDSVETAYANTGAHGRFDNVHYGSREEGACQIMGVYLMSKKLLEIIIHYCEANNLDSFRRDVLQGMCKTLNIRAYIYDGYCRRLDSLTGYFANSMELLNRDVRAELFDPLRPVKSKLRDDASTYYGPYSKVKNSLIADGGYIEGEVENCVIFRGVRVLAGAKVQNCVLMQDTVVSLGAKLNYAITDKAVTISEGTTLMGHESYPIAVSKGKTV